MEGFSDWGKARGVGAPFPVQIRSHFVRVVSDCEIVWVVRRIYTRDLPNHLTKNWNNNIDFLFVFVQLSLNFMNCKYSFPCKLEYIPC